MTSEDDPKDNEAKTDNRRKEVTVKDGARSNANLVIGIQKWLQSTRFL